MKVLLILNDAPYGTERSYNGLRLALALAKVEDTTVRRLPDGRRRRLRQAGPDDARGLLQHRPDAQGPDHAKGVEVGICGSCMDARGFTDADLAEGICRSSMAQLAEWTLWADKVVTF